MTEISIELVPRSLAALDAEVQTVAETQMLDRARAAATNLGVMPIRVDLATWLGDIL